MLVRERRGARCGFCRRYCRGSKACGQLDEGPVFPFRLALSEEDKATAWLLVGPRPDGTPCNRDERESLVALVAPIARAHRYDGSTRRTGAQDERRSAGIGVKTVADRGAIARSGVAGSHGRSMVSLRSSGASGDTLRAMRCLWPAARSALARRVAHRAGFEPTTPRFVVWCSIQLSYRCFRAAQTRQRRPGTQARERRPLPPCRNAPSPAPATKFPPGSGDCDPCPS